VVGIWGTVWFLTLEDDGKKLQLAAVGSMDFHG